MTLPVQEFQIGQRVRVDLVGPFVITAVCFDEMRFLYSPNLLMDTWFFSEELTLAPERLPYVASERRVVQRDDKHMRSDAVLSELYRCETDLEMLVRHSAEWDAYEAQGDAP